MEELKNLHFNRKNIISIVIFILLLVSIPIGTYLVKQQQIFKPKAAENKADVFKGDADKKPEYVQGEVLVKFKAAQLKVKEGQNSFQKGAFPLNNVEVSDNQTEQLVNFLKQGNFEQIEKVFKDADSPQQEVNEFKSRFPDRAPLVEEKAKNIDLSRIYKLTFAKETSVLEKLQYLASSSLVEYAEPNFIFKFEMIPNDPYYLDQYPNNVGSRDPAWNPAYDYLWGLKKINIESAWDRTTGSENIIIAVVDTGVDYNHPELAGRVIKGKDFANDDDDPIDDFGHGTHVAGTINAIGNNNLGITGASWGTKILAIKVGYDGLTLENGVAGINYAVQNGARVINASWGGFSPSQVLKDAIDSATAFKVIFVAAAGNDGTDARFHTPSALRNAISVGSSDTLDQKSDFSNYIGIDFLAPGGNSGSDINHRNILSLRAANTGVGSLVVNNNYLRQSGTSMATPLVSGVVGLLLSQNPALGTEEIRSILRLSADKGGAHWTPDKGYGRINIGKGFELGDRYNVARIISPDKVAITDNAIRLTFFASGQYFAGWILEYGAGIEPVQWQKISEGNTPTTINQPHNVDFDISSLEANNYTFRLRVLSNNTSVTETEDRLIIIKSALKQWSYDPQEAFVSSSPVVVDIDNDGKKEIIVMSMSLIHILNPDGSIKRTISLAPGIKSYNAESVTVADVDPNVSGKEILAIVFSSPEGDQEIGRKIKMFYADGRENTNGWPLPIGSGFLYVRESPPQVVDLDGDGQYEILATSGYGVYVFNRLGKSVSNQWPKIMALDQLTILAAKFSNPRLNQLQVLIANGLGEISIFDLQGNLQESFKLDSYYSPFENPGITATDLDHDGLDEIIIEHKDSNGNALLAVFKADGAKLWEKTLGSWRDSKRAPIVSDLNNDGEKEIIASDDKGIWFFNKNGDSVFNSPMVDIPYSFGLASGDRDGNGIEEVYFTQPFPATVGMIENGRIGFSYPFSLSFTFNGPVIDDIDNDNRLELIVHAAFGQPLFVFDLGPKNNLNEFNLGWPQYLFNEQRIGSDGICLKLYCDVNNDGKEDINDGNLVLSCKDKTDPLGACRKADAKCNGKIDIADIQAFASQCPQIFPSPTPTLSPTPIPTPSPTPSSQVQFCGGIAGVSCPAGYTCKLDGNYPDAGGVCIAEPFSDLPYTQYYRISDSPFPADPEESDIPWKQYSKDNTQEAMTFNNPSPGQNLFIFVQFKDSNGEVKTYSEAIEYIGE